MQNYRLIYMVLSLMVFGFEANAAEKIDYQCILTTQMPMAAYSAKTKRLPAPEGFAINFVRPYFGDKNSIKIDVPSRDLGFHLRSSPSRPLTITIDNALNS